MRPSSSLAIQSYLHAITGIIANGRKDPARDASLPRQARDLELVERARHPRTVRRTVSTLRPLKTLRAATLARALPIVLAGLFVAAVRAEPLTLNDAIQLALQKNPRIHVSAFSPQIARANVLQQYGQFDPAITFNRSYSQSDALLTVGSSVTQFTQTDNYSLELGGLAPWGLTYSIGGTAVNERGTFNGFAANYVTFGGVTVTQPLLRGFGFGANLAGLRVAKANRAISDWTHKQTVIDTVTNVIAAYNNVLLARDNLRIARFSHDLTAQLLDENEKRNRVGALADADVTQARARLATREEPILFAERAVHDAENQLRAQIGETSFLADGPTLDLAPLPPATPMTISPADDLKEAYAQRPDYQAARLGITKLRATDAQAQNQLLPRVDFVGSYGYNGLDSDFAASRRQVYNEDRTAYSAGVVVSVPLTFAQGRGQARAARLTLRQSEADLVRLEQDIAIAVATAAGQIETTRQRVAATRASLELAQRALDAEQKRYLAGTSRTLDVLTLQEQLVSVEGTQVQALTDERVAHAAYERLLGITLARHQITLN